MDGCEKWVQCNGLCSAHGGYVVYCQNKGCRRRVVEDGRCAKHAAGAGGGGGGGVGRAAVTTSRKRKNNHSSSNSTIETYMYNYHSGDSSQHGG